MPSPSPVPGAAPGGHPPGAGGSRARRRPGRWVYVVGALLVLVSVVASIALLAVSFVQAIDVRPLPGSGVGVVGEEPGTDIGLYEGDGVGAGACRASTVDGREVPVSSPSGSVTITRGEDEYQAIGRVTVPADGRLRVDCRGVPRAAVGPAPDVFGAVGRLFLVIGAGIVGTLLGVGLVVGAFLLRRRGPRA